MKETPPPPTRVDRGTARTFIIGTRSSHLALWQAHRVQALLPASSQLHYITTSGDRFRDIPLQGGSQTGFFTKEIEDLLTRGTIDIAVHSLKDLPTRQAPGLAVAACLERAPVDDLLLVSPEWHEPGNLLPVRAGCVIGAGSLRRQALVRLYAPAAVPTLIRGNVPTRVEKCRGGQYGAVLLARAGLERLGLDLSGLVVYRMLTHAWIPAPGQGAVAVEVRADDAEAVAVVSAIDHPATTEAVTLERELLARFEGGCHTAFGAHAVKSGDGWTVAVGMDRGEAGWGQTLYSGSRARCADHSPADLPGFAAVAVSRQEDLCVPYRP